MRPGLDTAIALLLREGPKTSGQILDWLLTKNWKNVTADEVVEACADSSTIAFDGVQWSLTATPTAPRPAAKPPGARPSAPPSAARVAPPTPAATGMLTELRAQLGITTRSPEPPRPAPSGWSAFADRAITALGHELATQTGSVSETDTPVSNGHFLGQSAQRHLLKYETQGPLFVADGSTVTLICGTRSTDAEVVARVGHAVTLAVPTTFTMSVEGRIRVDLTFLLRHQLDRYHALRSEITRFDTQAALAVIGEHDTSTQPPTPKSTPSQPTVDARYTAHLNDRQRDAVRRGLQPDISWIWGPPGTGKTTTLAALILALIDADQRVLLVSNTNTAVDTALTRVLADWPTDLPRPLGSVVRIGQPADQTLSDRGRDPVLVDEVAALKGAPLAERLADCRATLTSLRRQQADIESQINALNQRRGDLDRLWRDAQDARRAVTTAREHAQSSLLAVRQAEQAVRSAREAVLSTSEIAKRQARIQECQERASAARRGIDEAEQRYEQALARHRQALHEYNVDQPEHLLPALERDKLATQLRIAEAQVLEAELDDLMRELRASLIDSARLVAATVHRTYLKDLADSRFNVVVIDEASMLASTLTPLAAGLGDGHTVIAGDFRQLSPIAEAQTEEAVDMLHKSVFEVNGIDALIQAGTTPENLTALQVQHRMHPQIADLVSRAFYPEHGLTTPDSIRDRTAPDDLDDLLPDQHVWLIDTGPLRPVTCKQAGRRSRYNLTNVLLTAALLDQGLARHDLGLIAPYVPQTRLLSALLNSDQDTTSQAATVHRFQGGERDLIVYDTVETQSRRPHKWFREGHPGSEGSRLLNVAVSRARHHLVVLADVPALREHLIHGDPLSRLLRDLFERSEHLDWSTVVSHPQSRTSAVPAEEAISHLIADIDNAQHHLTLWTRDIDPTVLAQLSDPLTQAAHRGVQVTLWTGTHHADAIWDWSRAQPWEGDPGYLRLRPINPIVERHAVIDDVVWAGGESLLNPFNRTALRRRDTHLAEALDRVSRRAALGNAVAGTEPVPTCATCGIPTARVEAQAPHAYILAWQACPRCEPNSLRADGKSTTRLVTSGNRDRAYGTSDALSETRERLRKVGVHNFLVDDM